MLIDLDVLVPLGVAAIGAIGSRAAWVKGGRDREGSAVSGFSKLTEQLQQTVDRTSAEMSLLRNRITDCEDDRAQLRIELGRLQVQQEVLERQIAQFAASGRA